MTKPERMNLVQKTYADALAFHDHHAAVSTRLAAEAKLADDGALAKEHEHNAAWHAALAGQFRAMLEAMALVAAAPIVE
jgi:hypothetical protein